MPELSSEEAEELVARIGAVDASLQCGLASLPAHASTDEQLLELCRDALLRCTEARPACAALSAAKPSAAPQVPAALVAQSAAMRRTLETAQRLARSMIPVLIVGETGSGKEVLAHFIHQASQRGGPLRCINCGAIPSQLVESTLFGHERGAFTGANQAAQGTFEAAAGGTVLLDEIGELPADAQAALLRVLEEKRVARVGSPKEIEVDMRVLAATHRDLEQMCATGAFRSDLFYRLNAMTLHVPPLRERPEEIAELAERFVHRANEANGCHITGIEAAALRLLSRYRWPGNVRELRNAIERAVVIADGDTIGVDDLPDALRLGQGDAGPTRTAEPPAPSGADERIPGELSLRAEVDAFERSLIVEALRAEGWSREHAARKLGLPLRTLANKLRRHAIRIRTPHREGDDAC